MAFKKAFLFWCSLATLSLGEAKDLGVQGTVFEIEEEDLFKVIQNRLQDAQKSGKLEIFNQNITQKVKNSLRRPQPVEHLKKASKSRRYFFDPTLIVPQDIKDHKGRILVKAGREFNPLDYVSFGAPLLFVDGDDPEQIRWAKSQSSASKWVLVKGAPFDLMKSEKRSVFFDQGGILVKKFGIEAVPARVSQKDKKLLVEEITIQPSNEKEKK